jgi:hypothetical protein
MHHVLIRDEDDPTLYRRPLISDKERMVRDSDLYRVVSDKERRFCHPGPETLCNYDQPHEHGSFVMVED